MFAENLPPIAMERMMTSAEYNAIMQRKGITNTNAPREQPPVRARRGRMNKTEACFADTVLASRLRAGEIRSWSFEPLKIKIGNGAWLCPDFVIVLPDDKVEVYEIKGHRYAAGIVRVKAAAMIWPAWRFVLVMRGRGSQRWTYTELS